jgi:hypothetical protein
MNCPAYTEEPHLALTIDSGDWLVLALQAFLPQTEVPGTLVKGMVYRKSRVSRSRREVEKAKRECWERAVAVHGSAGMRMPVKVNSLLLVNMK